MDGIDSEMFQYFKSLLIRGFFEIRKNIDDLLILIEILMKGKLKLDINQEVTNMNLTVKPVFTQFYRLQNALFCKA